MELTEAETLEVDSNAATGYDLEQVSSGSKWGPPLEPPPRDAKQFRGRLLLFVAFQSLGAVYGDIGTSPLYTMSAIFLEGETPDKKEIIGGVSAVIWALILVVFVKTVVCSLPFATKEGEGGAFALYTGLSFKDVSVEEGQGNAMDRTETVGSYVSGKMKQYDRIIDRPSVRWILLSWALFGTALTVADGIFTPAVSIISCLEGIAVRTPALSDDVWRVTLVIITLLFLAQSVKAFHAYIKPLMAPIVVLWLLIIGVSGIYNITFYPGIFRAFDPSRAVLYFVDSRDYDKMSGVILAVTGVEALFANLGNFTTGAIELSCAAFVLPCLMLSYLGQGARIISDGPSILEQVFWLSIPGGHFEAFYWITFTSALLATIVASHCLITATFALVQQMMSAKCCPPFKLHHTSDNDSGAITIPSIKSVYACLFIRSTAKVSAISYALCIVVIGVVVGFKTGPALVNAYAFGVATVMICTTTLVSLQIFYVKNLHLGIAMAFLVFFGFIDALFWGATLRKVPLGAWLPLAIGVALTVCMLIWRWGKEMEERFELRTRINLADLLRVEERPLDRGTPSGQKEKGEYFPSNRTASDSLPPSIQGTPGLGSGHFNASEVPNPPLLGVPLQVTPSRGIHFTDEADQLPRIEKRSTQSSSVCERSTSRRRGLKTPCPDPVPTYNLGDPSVVFVSDQSDRPVALPRLTSMAIFQRHHSRMSAPHAFVAFLRHCPALPRVVVFLETRKSILAHVPYTDRYFVRRISSYPGFYSATLRLGFRDALDLTQSTDAILSRICVIERHLNEDGLGEERVESIVQASRIRTHFLTHLYLHAGESNVKNRWLRPICTRIRHFFLEDVYGRVANVFPEESGPVVPSVARCGLYIYSPAGWTFDEGTLLRVGLTAQL